MVKRLLTAVVGVPLIIAIVIFSTYLPVLINAAAAIICIMCVGEFSTAVKTIKKFQISIPSIIFSVAYPMLISYTVGSVDTGFLVCAVYTGIMLLMTVFFHKKISFTDFAYTYSMTMVITVAVSTIAMMKDMDVSHSAFYFILALALPWMADIGAFFAGSFLGKHKLCPSISPKKTIEGAVGGILLCVGASCLAGWIFSDLVYQKTVTINYINLCILAFTGAFLSIAGDLTFSVIKRYLGIKDYGFIIPGHGGFLDRFDSVVLVAPYIYIFISYLPILTMNGSVSK